MTMRISKDTLYSYINHSKQENLLLLPKFAKFKNFLSTDVGKKCLTPFQPQHLPNNNNNNKHQPKNKQSNQYLSSTVPAHLAQKRQLERKTEVDVVNAKVRDILSKMSVNNKDKLLTDFNQLILYEECQESFITNYYNFCMEVNYVIDIYVQLLGIVKTKCLNIYNATLNKIKTHTETPCVFNDDDDKTKRFRISHCKLLSHLYISGQIDTNYMKSCLNYWTQSLTDQTQCQWNIPVLLETMKIIKTQLKNNDQTYYAEFKIILESLYKTAPCDKRLKFMIQDIIDLYKSK